jgi:ATP-dependent Clp protease ATP-binding subunit ClpA
MFERFTKEAREAVLRAQAVARETGSRGVDTRHLLVALAEQRGPVSRALREAGTDVELLLMTARSDLRSDGLDRDALAALGIDLDAVRRQADAVFGADALERVGGRQGRTAFAPEAKKSLQLALREALRLRQRSVSSTHLMLGILRGECSGRVQLQQAGVDIDALRAVLEADPRAA